jgi:dTDP-4-amino-4,6-dideoxygalactose transaminase
MKIPFVDLGRAYETVAEQVARRCVSSPIYPEMKDDKVDYVASTTAALLA